MRENSKVRQHFELSLDGRQVAAVVGATLIALGGVFVLGASYGGRAARSAPSATAKDPLATLDEPLTASPRDDASLRAHEALTGHPDPLPSPAAKPVAAAAVRESEAAWTATSTLGASSNATSGVANPSAAPHPRDPAPRQGELGGSSSNANATSGVPNPAVSSHPREPAPRQGELGEGSNANPNATANLSPPPTALPTRTAALRPEPSREAKSKGEGAYARASPHRAAYTIQVASTAHRTDAERVAKRFSRRSPRIVAANVPGKGRVWRVQVGAYATRDAAARGLASLGGSGFVTAAR